MHTKEPFKTRTLIGWMWKCSDTWSWPILIAREAWLYNTQTAGDQGQFKAKQTEPKSKQNEGCRARSIKVIQTWFSIAIVNMNKKTDSNNSPICNRFGKTWHEELKPLKLKVLKLRPQTTITVVLATIARVNHLIPSRTQKWNLFALMVVWGYPCESKSSPAHYS